MKIGRIKEFDLIRLVACFLIVFMHSPMPTIPENGIYVSAFSFFAAPSIGLFFMISGALLLPVNSSFAPFIKNRFIKIAIPLLFWSLIYLCLNLYTSSSENNIWQKILSLPFTPQGHGILWFIYTLLGLYLLSPILSAWIKIATKREIEFILLLWVISLCYPLIEGYIMVNESPTGILYYFSGYAGYFLLGYYLRQFKNNWLPGVALAIGVGGICLILYLNLNGIEYDFYRLFWYLSIFVVAWCIVYWYIIKSIGQFISKPASMQWLIKASSLTFGIYLVHILIMREWLWKSALILEINNYLLQTLTIAVCSFLLSLIACYCISKVPYLRLTIGLKK